MSEALSYDAQEGEYLLRRLVVMDSVAETMWRPEIRKPLLSSVQRSVKMTSRANLTRLDRTVSLQLLDTFLRSIHNEVRQYVDHHHGLKRRHQNEEEYVDDNHDDDILAPWTKMDSEKVCRKVDLLINAHWDHFNHITNLSEILVDVRCHAVLCLLLSTPPADIRDVYRIHINAIREVMLNDDHVYDTVYDASITFRDVANHVKNGNPKRAVSYASKFTRRNHPLRLCSRLVKILLKLQTDLGPMPTSFMPSQTRQRQLPAADDFLDNEAYSRHSRPPFSGKAGPSRRHAITTTDQPSHRNNHEDYYSDDYEVEESDVSIDSPQQRTLHSSDLRTLRNLDEKLFESPRQQTKHRKSKQTVFAEVEEGDFATLDDDPLEEDSGAEENFSDEEANQKAVRLKNNSSKNVALGNRRKVARDDIDARQKRRKTVVNHNQNSDDEQPRRAMNGTPKKRRMHSRTEKAAVPSIFADEDDSDDGHGYDSADMDDNDGHGHDEQRDINGRDDEYSATMTPKATKRKRDVAERLNHVPRNSRAPQTPEDIQMDEADEEVEEEEIEEDERAQRGQRARRTGRTGRTGRVNQPQHQQTDYVEYENNYDDDDDNVNDDKEGERDFGNGNRVLNELREESRSLNDKFGRDPLPSAIKKAKQVHRTRPRSRSTLDRPGSGARDASPFPDDEEDNRITRRTRRADVELENDDHSASPSRYAEHRTKRHEKVEKVINGKRVLTGKFGDDEDMMLITGLDKYGWGAWAMISNDFSNSKKTTTRSALSLKDRARTLGLDPKHYPRRIERRGRPPSKQSVAAAGDLEVREDPIDHDDDDAVEDRDEDEN